jgi:hypothetical protein
MFRIEIFVDDKKLSYILWALTGHILGDPKIHPVANAAMKNGRLQAESSGRQMDAFVAFLRKLDPKTIVTSAIVRDFAEKNGWKGDSCYSITTRAVQHKMLKRVAGVRGTGIAASRYHIVQRGLSEEK